MESESTQKAGRVCSGRNRTFRFYSGNELAAEVQSSIHSFDWSPLLGPRAFEVTSRAKTIDTLRQKLRRDHSTPLSTIQDIGGVRFEAEMSLDEQDRVARQIAQIFGHDERSIHDLRVNPHRHREALLQRLELERSRVDEDWEIASLNGDSLETVQKTHARYFEGRELVAG